MTSPIAQHTDFTKDVLGRYLCNGLDEALASTSGVDGRPFDIVIIGGGSFGSALALHALVRDGGRDHRILVLDAGPYVVGEHVENLPGMELRPPPPTTTDPGVTRAEVWGLPWRSNVPDGFPGLAYCLGGRSMFWGGWSAELTEAETPHDMWPERVLRELRVHSPVPGDEPYFRQAAEQMGVTQTNDFVFGALHEALRQQIFDGIQNGAVADAVPLADLPLHVDPVPDVVDKDLLKLEAPLAVQSRPPRSGSCSIDTFSAMPLLMEAARRAQIESGGNDRLKRVMVVPNCHVTQLETEVEAGVGRVVAVHVGGGASIPIPARGVVVLASGTIESTRLALLSFPGTAGYDLIGTNLVSHVRSNHTFRVPRRSARPPDRRARRAGDIGALRQGQHDPSRHRRHREPLPRPGHRRRTRRTRTRAQKPSCATRCSRSRRSRTSRRSTTTMSSSRCAASASSSRAIQPTA